MSRLSAFKGELHPKPKLNMFFVVSQIFNTFLKHTVIILKQIAWDSQNGIKILEVQRAGPPTQTAAVVWVID